MAPNGHARIIDDDMSFMVTWSIKRDYLEKLGSKGHDVAVFKASLTGYARLESTPPTIFELVLHECHAYDDKNAEDITYRVLMKPPWERENMPQVQLLPWKLKFTTADGLILGESLTFKFDLPQRPPLRGFRLSPAVKFSQQVTAKEQSHFKFNFDEISAVGADGEHHSFPLNDDHRRVIKEWVLYLKSVRQEREDNKDQTRMLNDEERMRHGLSRLDRYVPGFYRGVSGALSNIKKVYPVFVAAMLIIRIGLLVAMIAL